MGTSTTKVVLARAGHSLQNKVSFIFMTSCFMTSYFMTSYLMTSYFMTLHFMTSNFMALYYVTSYDAWCMMHNIRCMMYDAWFMMHDAWCMMHIVSCIMHHAWHHNNPFCRSESSYYKLGRLDNDCLFWNLCWDQPTQIQTSRWFMAETWKAAN